MNWLLDSKEIEMDLSNLRFTFRNLKEGTITPGQLWSLLYNTGYLTQVYPPNSSESYKIPNQEIM